MYNLASNVVTSSRAVDKRLQMVKTRTRRNYESPLLTHTVREVDIFTVRVSRTSLVKGKVIKYWSAKGHTAAAKPVNVQFVFGVKDQDVVA
jgi:hypothetical protein